MTDVVIGEFDLVVDTDSLARGPMYAPERYVEFTPTGARWREDTPYEICSDIYRELTALGKQVQWWIADTLNFAERRYGETYAQMLAETDYSYQALRDMKWVGAAVDASRRRDNLSFDHHRTVAALPPDEQDAWLDRAEAQQLSRDALRESVQVAQRPAQVDGLPDDIALTLHFHWSAPGVCEITIEECPNAVAEGRTPAVAYQRAAALAKLALEERRVQWNA